MSAKPKPAGLLASLKSKVEEDSRPEGWKTLQELIAVDPMSKTRARALLNQAIKAGAVEVKKFKSPIGGGRFALRFNYKDKA